jgi:hypothetical protein
MDEDLLFEVRQAAEKEGATVSAWLAEAARRRVKMVGLAQLVAEWEAENGAFTEEELAEAEAEFDAAGVVDRRPQRRHVEQDA